MCGCSIDKFEVIVHVHLAGAVRALAGHDVRDNGAAARGREIAVAAVEQQPVME